VLALCKQSFAYPTPAGNGYDRGFTLIELSIVLVVIGLILGGVLVGQSLISAAGVRAQIRQIEKYQTAVNTFRGKYGYLPGDIPNPYAYQFGFATRGSLPGQGDGNGLLEGNYNNSSTGNYGGLTFEGEEAMFWVDLSAANLIDGSFIAATPTALANSLISGAAVGKYFPQAKISASGYIYVWSGGWQEWANNVPGDSLNYFELAAVTGNLAGGGQAAPMPLLTPAQAYAIDKKADDGMPQTGNIIAFDSFNGWASGGGPGGGLALGDGDGNTSGPITPATRNPYYDDQNGATTPQTCYSNGDTLKPEQYSVSVGGANINCVLSFRFQ